MAELGFNISPEWSGAIGFPGEPAFTQFLNEDLRRTSVRGLNTQIFSVQVEKAVFEGKLVLQILEVRNVNENPQTQHDATKQTLRFRLTDGFDEVVGVEQGATGIPASVGSGTKVVLIGPVVVRRGVVLLNSCNLLLLSPPYDDNMSGGCEFEDCSDPALFTCLCNSTLLCSAHLVKHVQAHPELPHSPVPGLYKSCPDLETYTLTKQVEKHQIPALDNSLHERERLRAAKDSFFHDLDVAKGKIRVMLKGYLTSVRDRFLHCSADVELEIGAKKEAIRKHVAEFGWKEDSQLFICKSDQDLDEVKHAVSSAIRFRLIQPSTESSLRNYISTHKGELSDEFLGYLLQLSAGESLSSISLAVSNAAWFDHLRFLFENVSDLKELKLRQCEDIGDGGLVLEQFLPRFAGSLVELSLDGLGLTAETFGQLTQTFSVLTALQKLSIKGNRLRDEGMTSVCSVLSTLPELQSLNLATNIISYIGVQALAEALPKSLLHLDLSQNSIGNQGLEYLAQTFTQLVSLESLSLSECGLKASMDEYWTAFGKLWNLRTLDLSGNLVPFGVILPVLGSLTRLTALKLANAGLEQLDIIAFAQSFAAFPALEAVDLSKAIIGNEGSSSLALNMSRLKSIKQLTFTGCNFDKEGIVRLATGIQYAEGVEELVMKGVNIGREGGLHFSCGLRALSKLKVLNLAETGLSEDGGTAIAVVLKHLSRLEVLILRDNHNIGGAAACELAKSLLYLSQIRVLDLWNCGFQPEGVAALAPGLIHLTSVETLNLGQNEIGLAGMKALNFPLSHLTMLKVLNMVGCMLGSQGALHLSLSLLHLTQLTELYLTSNNFGNEGVGHIGNSFCFLTSLKKLSISENHFGRDALFKLCRAMTPMSNLREFCLFSNEFGVHMPRSILTSIASRISMSYVELQDYNVDDLQRELQAALPMVETIT